MTAELMGSRGTRREAAGENVRIGPLTLFVLIVVLCMAVLAVLAVSTAGASQTMTARIATATEEQYLNESAAQVLVAGVDGVLGDIRSSRGSAEQAARALETALPGVVDRARQATQQKVDIEAFVEGKRFNATFTCKNGRKLRLEATILEDVTYHIDRWKMVAVENEEQPTGTLWTGA